MERKQKRIYASPTAKAIEMQMNGMLCSSKQDAVFWLYDHTTDPTDPSSFGDTLTWDE